MNLFWILSFHLDCSVWFEWVDSGSNWADGVSRLMELDPFAAEHGFAFREMKQPASWWSADLAEVWGEASRVA